MIENNRRRIDPARFSPHADTLKFNPVLAKLWQRHPSDPGPILKIAITLSDLVEHSRVTRNLFDPDDRHQPLNNVLDQTNQRYCPNTLYFGGTYNSRGAAPRQCVSPSATSLNCKWGKTAEG